MSESGFNCVGSMPAICSGVCGDGAIGGEGCDDGNTNSGDGCDSTCNVETNYACIGEPSVCSI